MTGTVDTTQSMPSLYCHVIARAICGSSYHSTGRQYQWGQENSASVVGDGWTNERWWWRVHWQTFVIQQLNAKPSALKQPGLCIKVLYESMMRFKTKVCLGGGGGNLLYSFRGNHKSQIGNPIGSNRQKCSLVSLKSGVWSSGSLLGPHCQLECVSELSGLLNVMSGFACKINYALKAVFPEPTSPRRIH